MCNTVVSKEPAKSRRGASIMATSVFFLVIFLSFNGSVAARDTKPAWQLKWEETVSKAEQEGQLKIYSGSPFYTYHSIINAFRKSYPGIKVVFIGARGSQIAPRIMAERRAGKYWGDIYIGGKGSLMRVLWPGKIFEPIKPLLILPEVVDQSKWWKGKHRYVDPEERYVFVFVGNPGGGMVYYNRNLVDPKEIKSFQDLLNPKWKGKITATDPRVGGMDSPTLFMYYTPSLGPEFMRRLFGDMDITIARSLIQPINWLARGKFALCIPCHSRRIKTAIAQGLPLGKIGNLKEGETLSSGGHTITFMNRAPHPNAAAVFINWLLSRKGQMLIQTVKEQPRHSRPNSYRIDIPKDVLSKDRLRLDGFDYFVSDDPKVSDRRPADKLYNEIFSKRSAGSNR